MTNDRDAAAQIVGWLTGALIPALALISSWLRNRSLRFFLLTQRLRSLFSKDTPAWRLSAQFHGDNITSETLEKIMVVLAADKRGANSISIKQTNRDVKEISYVPGPTFEISHHRSHPAPHDIDQAAPAYIQVAIRNYEADYRKSSYAIKHRVIPILEDVSRIIQNVNASYSLVIEYPKSSNPFFGLYVASLSPSAISSFSVRLVINDYEPNDTIDISETRLAIHTRSQNALQHLAVEFLTFDMNLGERLNNAP